MVDSINAANSQADWVRPVWTAGCEDAVGIAPAFLRCEPRGSYRGPHKRARQVKGCRAMPILVKEEDHPDVRETFKAIKKVAAVTTCCCNQPRSKLNAASCSWRGETLAWTAKSRGKDAAKSADACERERFYGRGIHRFNNG
mmetsp:Transcript_151140/g.289669  ORF Transcript_151140/g.289669 Transcript_151140/m.289669 type:complete len:142 (+) Transcript_151140:120-545(+)